MKLFHESPQRSIPQFLKNNVTEFVQKILQDLLQYFYAKFCDYFFSHFNIPSIILDSFKNSSKTFRRNRTKNLSKDYFKKSTL